MIFRIKLDAGVDSVFGMFKAPFLKTGNRKEKRGKGIRKTTNEHE